MDRLGKKDFVRPKIENASTVTSASRNAKNLEDLPFTAYVITKEMIASRGYQTLVDVLKDIPGTRVSQPGSAEHGETFSMRGLFGNYYAKILLDNVPIQPSATNGMPIEAQFPIQSIERIEVIMGPASDVYGADAMAGVINIVTQKEERIKWGNASLIMGSPYLTGVKFTLGGKVGKGNRVYRYTMFGGFQQMRNKNIVAGHNEVYNPLTYSNGDSSFIASPFYRGSFTLPDFNGLPSASLNAGLRFSGKHLTIGFDAMQRSEQSAIGLNPLTVTYHNPNHKTGERIFRGFMVYNTNIGEWNSRSYASWLSYRMDRGNSYSTVQNPLNAQGVFYMYSASDDLYLEQTMNYQWASGLSFQASGTFQYSGNFPIYKYLLSPFDPGNYRPWSSEIRNSPFLDSLGFAPFNFSNVGLMGQLYYEKGRWEAMFGLRFDYHSKFYGAINPRIGFSFKASPKSIIRFSSSTGFRPPSSYLIYSSYRSVVIDGDTVGIPSPQFDLDPEDFVSIDIGFKQLISKKSSFDVVAFYHETLNSIVKTLNNQGDELFYGYQNSPNSRRGLFGVQVQYVVKDIGLKKLFSDFSVSYSKGFEELPFNQGTLSDYREMPNWIGKWLIGFYPMKDLSLSLRNQFSSSWLSSSVVTSDVNFEYQVASFYTMDILINYSATNSINLFCNIFNVTDSKYGGISAVNDLGIATRTGAIFTESLYYNPQYGTKFTVGANINF
ncbi:MAG: TonB-dependent receptor [Schleiferiaceae bacterium]|nr:TonB-dependent receptor [Schleiferiaceae bacterium]